MLALPVAVAALISAGATSAQDAPKWDYQSDLTNPDKPMQIQRDEIIATEELPNPFTHAVRLRGRDGIAYVSQNGRFVMRGVIFDMWTGDTIETMEELAASKQAVNLADLGIKDEDVDPMFYGSGPRSVQVFVDPLCPYCAQLLDQMRSDPAFARDYRFKIFTVPFLGDDSVKAVNALSCASDRDAALEALMSHDRRWMQAQAQTQNCDVAPVLQRTILSQMVGVTGVPFIIAPEGGIARGLPQDLRGFLATN